MPLPTRNNLSKINIPLYHDLKTYLFQIRAASIASRAPPSAVRDEILRVSAVKLKETNRVKEETELVKQQQQILAAQDPVRYFYDY